MRTYKVIYTQESIDRIEKFIEYVRFSIFRRFFDSGIHGVSTILQNYDDDLGDLESSIFSEFDRLGSKGIIGTIYSEEGSIHKTRLIFPIRSYNITAWCSADKEAGILTVESISINT